jgi:hypothetical protein
MLASKTTHTKVFNNKKRLHQMKKNTINIAIATLGVISLCGCGGGSDSSNATGTSLAGNVADGYLVGAKVCLDENNNTTCDATEPMAITTQHGAYTITGISASDITTYPLLVEVNQTTIDEDTNLAVPQNYVLQSPPGNTFISPISSMVLKYMQDNKVGKSTAKTTIATQLGISDSSLITGNYLDSNSSEAQAVHKKAQVIAAAKMNVMQQIKNAISSTMSSQAINTYIDNKVIALLPSIKNSITSNTVDVKTVIASINASINTTTAVADMANMQNTIDLNTVSGKIKNTTLQDLLNPMTIQQDQAYRVTYSGGTDLKLFTVNQTANKDCKLYVLNSTSTTNPYSSYAYLVNGDNTGGNIYNLQNQSGKDSTASVGWMYYTTTDSHLDFVVDCVDKPTTATPSTNTTITAPTTGDPAPVTQKSIIRQGYARLLTTSDSGYIAGAVTYSLDSYIQTGKWFSYSMTGLNFTNGSANPKDSQTIINQASLTTTSTKAPSLITCKFQMTKTSSPQEYDSTCKTLDSSLATISTKTAHVIGDNITIDFDATMVDSNSYYFIDMPAFSTNIPK